MSSIRIMHDAHELYLSLDAKCHALYKSVLVSNYVADEIRRYVLQLSVDPRQHHLMRHRIPKGNPIEDYWYTVIIPTPTGIDDEVAVIWTFHPEDGQAIILDIELEYRR
jgi:hypothetical protein